MKRSLTQSGAIFLLMWGIVAAQPPPFPVQLSPVVYSDMTTLVLAGDMTASAWISSRPSETVGPQGVADGYVLFELSSFSTTWSVGETLIVEIHGAGSNYTQPEDRVFMGVIQVGGVAWISQLGPNNEFYLPVELTAFRAEVKHGTVVLTWITATETDNAGFNLYRAHSDGGIYQQINVDLIPGAGTSSKRHDYRHVDRPPLPGVYFYKLECISTEGESQQYGPIEARMWRASFKLYAVTPSPMVTTSRIAFDLPSRARVALAAHDLAGRRVKMLHDGELRAGHHAFSWDGLDTEGRAVGNGLYLIRMVSGGIQQTERVVVLR